MTFKIIGSILFLGEVMEFTILEIRRFKTQENISSRIFKRTVKDYEIDYELGPGRTMFVNGEKHVIECGDVCFRRPNEVVYSEGYQDTIILTASFIKKELKTTYNRNIFGELHPKFSHELINNLPSVIKTKNGSFPQPRRQY